VTVRPFTSVDLARLEGFILGHGRSVTLAEFAEGDRAEDAVAVRHDIDHDIEYALRFAAWEAARGIRATYFVLPTASYWGDQATTRRCSLAIQELGHEVGVHNDAYCVARGDITVALSTLAGWADQMRAWGIAVHGCADHGGSGWSNVDMWRTLGKKPEDAGLQYEAYLLHQLGTNYISDNQGTWRAPMVRVARRQTHLLVHPIHWPVEEAAPRAAAAA